ncbi:8-amino-7-oxononanoate synthase [Desulfoplanes formicivorans]|uniref:8-amino-7-ketopelargonate synthase n=1 Tax=Desulfoplanes formicivorans TaxID=1592317 RepID=A0A194AJU5_9BACT|nr:8-amino-7-oxononanoate synthase [Desulfoplanes formicivorans]GAU08999.1 8-amino-7-oxononanoate synthase [Desulfoplanes formicivorans]
MSFFDEWLVAKRNSLKTGGRWREIPDIDHGADLIVSLNGRQVINLASNNYLGLAGQEAMKEAAMQGVMAYGTSSGASRLVTGTFGLYNQLESALAELKKQEACLVFGSGYAANVGLVTALAGRGSVVFSDRLNHASIVDGIVLSRARHVRYRHNDMDHLAYCLKKNRDIREKFLITDSVFSMDGDRADLGALVALCREHDVIMAVDEAHATGIVGQGRGLACELGLEREIHLHMGTLSKGLGSYGGFVCARQEVVDLLKNLARSFVFSTALPPSVIGAGLCGVRWVQDHPQEGDRLLELAARFRGFLASLGFDVGPSTTQIIPVIIRDNAKTLWARDHLLASGVLVAAIRPPTVPQGTSRLRLALRADMLPEHLAKVRTAFVRLQEAMA